MPSSNRASLYSVTGECISIDLESPLLKGKSIPAKAGKCLLPREEIPVPVPVPVYKDFIKDYVKVVTVVLRMYYGAPGGP